MKIHVKLLILGCAFWALQSCSEEPILDDLELEEAIDEVVVPDVTEVMEVEEEAPKPAQDYHITLNKGADRYESGLGAGDVTISDVFLCSVNDWKMRIITEQFDPHQMVGQTYKAHIISDDYNSTKCQCEINSVMGTGIKNEVGERVKAEGSITCDDGKVKGAFRVQLLSPGG